MTRETKFGLLFVVVLTGVFGMLVYKRLHQPLGLVAGTDVEATPLPEEVPPAPPTAPAPPLLDTAGQLNAGGPALSGTRSPTPTAPQRPASPNAGATAAFDAFAGSQPAATESTAASPSKPRMPTNLDDDGFFDPPATPRATMPATDSEPEFVAATPVPAATNPAAAPADPFAFEAEQPATASAPKPAAAEPAEAFDPFADPAPSAGSPATTAMAVPNEAPETAMAEPDPFADTPAAAPKTEPVALTPPEEPTEVAVESDPFAVPAPRPQASTPSLQPAPAMTFVPEESSPAAPLPEASPPVAAAAIPEKTTEFLPAKTIPADDPFLMPEPAPPANTAPPANAQNSVAVEFPVPAAQELPLAAPAEDPFMNSTASAPAAPAAEPNPFDDTKPEAELKTVATVPLVPVTTARPLPTTLSNVSAAPARVPVNTGSYVVQPGDNFWTISKQVYGTGRYFQALAKHNASIIADPQRMKPETRVATPPAQQLESLYRADIPLAHAPAVQALRENHPERYTPDAEPGFFVDAAGQPMYRVGSSDTLSEIAKNHLGRSSRWQQIFVMNRDILKDGNTLSVGAILKLPGDASQVQMVGFDKTNR